MTDKDILELSSMFTTAAQLAKSRDKVEYKLEMDVATMSNLLKKAFPTIKDEAKIYALAESILAERS